MQKPRLIENSIECVEVMDEDHLGEFSVMLTEWPNGEGYDLRVTEYSPFKSHTIEISDSQADAFKKALKTIRRRINRNMLKKEFS